MIFHVDMDAFFPSVEVLLHPEYKGKPLVVGADPKGRGVVSSCSYEARKYGIHSAMPIGQAYQLCPHAVFVKGTPGAYCEYSRKIKEVFLKYSPVVQMMSLDEAYLEMTGLEKFYGDMLKTAEKLQREILDVTGLSCSIGIARSKVTAKVASDYKKPGGITYVLDREREFLHPLPIRSLPLIGPKMQQSLHAMGITSIGQVADLEEKVMEQLFGKHGTTIWEYANALDGGKIKAARDVKSVGREKTFPQDVVEYDTVKKALVYVLERALYDMRKSKFQAKTVTLKLRYGDFKTVTRARTLEPGDTFSHFFPALEDLLNETWKRKVRIRLIGVRFTSLSDNSQQELFAPHSQLKRQKVDEKIDHLRERYGFHIIKPASLFD